MFYCRSGASVSSPNFDAVRTDKSILRPVSSTDKPQVLDALNMVCPNDFHPPAAKIPNDVTNRNTGNVFKRQVLLIIC